MEEILKEFGEIGAPSIYEITKLVYESKSKYNSDKNDLERIYNNIKFIKAQESIDEARDIIESIGETCPVYVGFEKETYVVTGEQMKKIYTALYLADCELQDIQSTQCKCN